MKRLESDYCLLRNCDVRQARTAGECGIANGHHAARYCDVCQAITSGKRKIVDSVYAVRDRDARQTATIVERARSDFFQSIWQVNIYKRRAFGKRITSDFGYSIWEHDADQATAIFERLLTNDRHAFRYRNAGQAIATAERQVANQRHAVRNSDAGQISAIEERLIADARDLLPVMDRWNFDVGVGAGSDSGNGAGSVTMGLELQAFRVFVQGGSGGKDSGGFHGENPFFPWRSSLGVMPLRTWRYHIGGNRPLRFSSGLGTGNGRITVALDPFGRTVSTSPTWKLRRLNRLRRPPPRRQVRKYAPLLRQGGIELFRVLPSFQQAPPLPTPTSFQGGVFPP